MRSARSSSPPPSASPSRSADRRAARGGAAQRRDRHGPCTPPRRRPDRGVPPDHALRPQRPFHDGNRPSPCARPQRDEGAVQADRAPGGPDHRGLRVDAALGSSPARPDRPRGLHVDCRGNRPHRQAERVPAGADRPGARCVAERARGRAADLRQRQHVEPSPSAPRSAAGREDGHRPHAASCPAPSRSR